MPTTLPLKYSSFSALYITRKNYFCIIHPFLQIMTRYSLLLTNTLFLWLMACATSAQTNRALLVSISRYPESSGWEHIHAYNDAILACSLLATCGYAETNIISLADEHATKRSILSALKKLCADTRLGDYLYLHFSCHGQQMMDDNGDEEDGLDEALIPYDALFWYTPGKYEGENHLRDDELGHYLNSLRRKAGAQGHITMVLDACHSGTGNRLPKADDYIRGTSYIFAPDDYIPTEGKHQELSLRLIKSPELAPTLVISACLADEINYEYFDSSRSRYSGLLTYAFCETALEARLSPISVAQLLQRLNSRMQMLTAHRSKRKQTPYIECTDLLEDFSIGRKQ